MTSLLKKYPWTSLVVFAFLLVLVLAYVKYTQIMAAIAFGESFPEPSETVQLTQTEESSWQPMLELVGEVRASRAVELRNELDGFITAVDFVSGQAVEQGQRLLQIDISEEAAALAGAKADYELASANLNRLLALNNPDAVSRIRLDEAKAQRSTAAAAVARLESIINRKTITAPFSGRVGVHQFEVGEYLAANTQVTRLVDTQASLWVDFRLPQQYGDIAMGTPVQVTSTASGTAGAAAPMILGEVIAIDPDVERSSRTRRARVQIEPSPSVVSGSLVTVSVPVGDVKSVVRLPSAAVRVDAFGRFVYLIATADDGKLRAARQPVTEVGREGETSIIDSGLVADQTVATVGAFKLSEGLWVKEAGATASAQTE